MLHLSCCAQSSMPSSLEGLGPTAWSVWLTQVLCDFAGGILSLFQLCLEVRLSSFVGQIASW